MKDTGKNKAGLDIGSHFLKVVEISQGTEKPALVAFGMKKITNPSREALAAQVKSLLDEIRISSRDLSVSISGPSVIVRFLSMPKMKDEDLRSAIKFEAEKFIPFNMADCVIDSYVVRMEVEENKIEILLVAAKKTQVEERIKLVESASFSVRVVDLDSIAIVNSFLKNFTSAAEGPEKTCAILNIGAAVTNLCIFRSGQICLVRDVAMGGNDFTSVISRTLGLDPAAAEEIKCLPKDKLPEIVACTKATISAMLDELRLSFSYYENQCGRNIDEIYMTGGSSLLAGIEGHLEEALGLKPKLWDPFQFLNKEPSSIDVNALDKVKRYFAVAVGLALR